MAEKNNALPKDTSVLFATFSLWSKGARMPTNGSVEPFRDFLIPHVSRLVIIDQLVPGSEDVFHKIEVYSKGDKKYKSYKPSVWFYFLWPLLKITNYNGTHIVFKIRDFLSIIDWVIRDRKRYDYFIGLESVNALAGILLRRLGVVRKVIYYVSDYSPQRYPQKWFNFLYLFLDRFSATHADFIWDVSRAIHPARIRAGLRIQSSAPVIHVNNGLFPSQIKIQKLSQIKKHSIVFMGTVGPENGPDVAVRALALVRKKYKNATLHIIGGTQNSFAWLVPIIREHKQEKHVIFHGFIPDVERMAEIMRSCMVAVAPYRSFRGSPRYYGDAGKIRAYCAGGLPIVSSKVPPLGREVEQKGAAVVVSDDERAFAKAIVQIFSVKKKYLAMRKAAISVARTNTWNHQFTQAFVDMARVSNKQHI